MYAVPDLNSSELKPTGDHLEVSGVINPLAESVHDLELRFYFTANSPSGDAMIALKGNKESLWADCYYYGFFKELFRDFKTFQLKDKPLPLLVSAQKVLLTHSSDSILTELFNQGAFVMNSHANMVDSLQKTQPLPLDGYGSAYYQIKVGNRFHSVSINPTIAANNAHIEVLTRQARIYSLFLNLYRKSGLKIPSW